MLFTSDSSSAQSKSGYDFPVCLKTGGGAMMGGVRGIFGEVA
jgi:uncharacterized membrane protein